MQSYSPGDGAPIRSGSGNVSQIVDYVLPEHLAARKSAQRREWVVQITAAAIAIVSITTAAELVPTINNIRIARQLVINPDKITGLPPDLALLGKLGTFRALAIDWAFIRADRLKEEGKYYEAYELHDTICKLAPRFPKVWVHAAWNMAYNISVAQYTPEARWQWVSNGIKVLRDGGIHYNPKSVTLYKELTWIYWHKIGDFLDDEHLNYKKALAVEMESVLGPPPVTLTDADYIAWFDHIVAAPRNLQDFLASDAEVARLAFQLKSVGLPPDATLLEFVARRLRDDLRPADLAAQQSAEPDFLLVQRLELLRKPEDQETLQRLLAAVRSDVLRNTYHMDLDWMAHLMKDEYGPLDWRNAFSHGLYWSSKGDEEARGHVNLDVNDQLNNARLVFFALNNLVMRGRIVLIPDFDDPFKSYIEMLPDTRYISYSYDTYMRLGKEYFGDRPDFIEGTPGPNYMNGFVTAMENWIELLYLEGGESNIERAEAYYAWLRKFNPHPDGSVQERYLITLDEFVNRDIIPQMSTYRSASAILRSLVDRGLKQFSLSQIGPGLRSLIRARFCYKFWMQDTRNDINERRMMQPFPIIVRDQVEGFMKSPTIGPMWKVRLWKSLPEEHRQMVYDRLLPQFVELCAAQSPQWSVEKSFPEPPDMEAARQRTPDYTGEPDRSDSTGTSKPGR